VPFVFPSSGWEPEYGGFTSYIAKGEDEEVSKWLPSVKFSFLTLEKVLFFRHQFIYLLVLFLCFVCLFEAGPHSTAQAGLTLGTTLLPPSSKS
jgi:hypothetical protein